MAVTPTVLETWGITVEQLHQDALVSDMNRHPMFCDMQNMMESMMFGKEPENLLDDSSGQSGMGMYPVPHQDHQGAHGTPKQFFHFVPPPRCPEARPKARLRTRLPRRHGRGFPPRSPIRTGGGPRWCRRRCAAPARMRGPSLRAAWARDLVEQRVHNGGRHGRAALATPRDDGRHASRE